MAKIAILSALSYILYLIKVPLPFLPSFLEFNLSDIPALIGGFALGPTSALIIVTIKILLKLPLSSTYMVGELGDLIIGLSFTLPAAFIYQRKKTLRRAVMGLLVGALVSIVLATLSNALVLIPFYSTVLTVYAEDGTVIITGFDIILNVCRSVIPQITSDNFYLYYLLLGVLPFNLIRCGAAAIITFFVYKSVSRVFNKF